MRLSPIGELIFPVQTWNPSSQAEDGTFRYIDLSAIDSETKTVRTIQEVRLKDAPSRARQLVKSGDILVSTVRPNLNGVAKLGDALDGATASTGFCVLRPNIAVVDGAYLFQWVRSPAFISDMVRKATGASYPAVSDRIIAQSIVPLPPLAEQRQIAAILDQADTLRRKRQEALERLGTLSSSIFVQMFGDIERNSFGWPEEKLSEVVREDTIVTYGIVQAGGEFEDGVPYIRTGDIVDGEIKSVQLRRTDPNIAAKFARSRVETNEIVMSIRATVGTTALIPPELDGSNLTQGTARISPGNRTDRHYLLAYLRSNCAQKWLQRQVKGATFREITLNRLREMPILVPPLDRQHTFATRVVEIDSLKVHQRAHLTKLGVLFASLQHRAFRGEL